MVGNNTTQTLPSQADCLGNNSDIHKKLNKSTKRSFKESEGIEIRTKGRREKEDSEVNYFNKLSYTVRTEGIQSQCSRKISSIPWQ